MVRMKMVFYVRAYPDTGSKLIIVGDTQELGAGDPEKAPEFEEIAGTYNYKLVVSFVRSPCEKTYRYAIKNPDGLIIYEEIPPRTIPKFKTALVVREGYNTKPPSSMFIARFRVAAQDALTDQMFLIGDAPELGCWERSNSLQLFPADQGYFSVSVPFKVAKKPIELRYKIFTQESEDDITWDSNGEYTYKIAPQKDGRHINIKNISCWGFKPEMESDDDNETTSLKEKRKLKSESTEPLPEENTKKRRRKKKDEEEQPKEKPAKEKTVKKSKSSESTKETPKKKKSKSSSNEDIKKAATKKSDELSTGNEEEEDNNRPEKVVPSGSKNNLRDEDMHVGEISDDMLYETDTETESEEQLNNNSAAVQKIFAHRVVNDEQTEYFVKFFNKSYKACQWVPKEQVFSTKHGEKLAKRYHKEHPKEAPPLPYFNPIFETPEKIVGSHEKDGVTYYLTKWTKLDYDQNTWETAESLGSPELISQFEANNKIPPMQDRFIPPKPSPEEYKPIEDFPQSKSGYTIRPYQIEGVCFLVKSWFNNQNAILADEMGLGKTLQSISFLYYLHRVQKVWGPFLIICPLSTIEQWEREIKEWTTMKVACYSGIKPRRDQMAEYELFFSETPIPKFHILLTTYEYIISDRNIFNSIEWQVICIDEAHRLKNTNSKLMQALKDYHTQYKLLLTGTPLQNNITELWSLLNYLDEEKFNDIEAFQAQFGKLEEHEQITELQGILKPLMLRRMKSDVEKGIKPLEEVIIECAMTQHQKLYYQSIYQKNTEYLTRGAHKNNSTNLNNIFMELRKVCNHPYLLNGAEEQILIERRDMSKIPANEPLPDGFVEESLIRSSGKMILLDKLLAKLKNDGHRVLIFSQMTRMLDILQDYLYNRGYEYERIDGTIRGDERQKAIDRYNKPNSPIFVFLLCTHAGGLGINLTSADTVIIYDSDWNPQNDIQATARCHRIGQTKEVKVYRFITANSYERKMFDRASYKLGLDHAVLEGTGKQQMKTEDIEKLLRLGAYYAFEKDDKTDAEKFGEEDIDSIINRSTKIKHTNIGAGDGSTFSKAKFEVDDENEDVDISDPNFWQKYLPVVVEDDIYDDMTIAERRRFKREVEGETGKIPAPEFPLRPIEKRGTLDFYWSHKKLDTLVINLMRFGWGRWRIIYENCGFSCEISEIKAVSHVVISWLCEAFPNQSQILEAIYRSGISPETEVFEEKFNRKRRDDFEPNLIKENSNWRVSRLEFLHFLNSAVQGCSNAPDDLIVPNVIGSKPAEWWTSADDKLLLHGVYLHGFGNNEKLKFSRSDGINQKVLTSRLKSIINGLKNNYIRYKEENGVEIPFNYQTLSKIFDTLSKRDHKTIIFMLQNYGFVNHEEFREICGLTNKSLNLVSDYVDKLVNYCHELEEWRKEKKAEAESNQTPAITASQSIDILQNNELKTTISIENKNNTNNEENKPPKSDEKPRKSDEKPPKTEENKPKGEEKEEKDEEEREDPPWILEKLMVNTGVRIIQRIDLFDKVREKCDDPKFTGTDKEILQFVAEHGLVDINDNARMKEIFEGDPSEGKVVKKLKDLVKTPHERKPRISGHEANLDGKLVIVPNYEVDDKGNPIFPINLSPSSRLISLGKVVYDRPNFHNARYLYTDGFCSEKLYISAVNPSQRVWYRSEILDRGGEFPYFKVSLVDQPDIYWEGNAPSNPWICIIRQIEAKKRSNRALTISGPDYFCLTHPITISLMQKLENADKCDKYVKRRLEEDPNAIESLQQQQLSEASMISPIIKVARERSAKRAKKSYAEDEGEDENEGDEFNESDSDQVTLATKKSPKKKPGSAKKQLTFNFQGLLNAQTNIQPSFNFKQPQPFILPNALNQQQQPQPQQQQSNFEIYLRQVKQAFPQLDPSIQMQQAANFQQQQAMIQQQQALQQQAMQQQAIQQQMMQQQQ
ncbi:F/Y-rich N-terminus family protein [Trichomonas vaginalis G3]|uniref:F/Y-rich N-terminus family protein n=1 Tax=Trichomonas vaginalis (strain ATCC PRA-98 / G3) TaxID=412133 RepID=A2D9P9_TRIV3|nr:histone methyltransferase activity (H3-K4 specific) [Trichomonas vaginalis G3]EAY22905.1 F/Y-rich N-terminus family protein [Trichomonas vaginalis G3]KAI5527369.1 histone methyltransferase activity (H3-K4 specific) [Trichomonas vaginalis G3]|eukprot:XP_001583891.1 F/Y-rich N-terminus family protein [Trichomonas vaginalis G3]